MASISFEHVGKVYPDGTRALQDLCLMIEDGESMALVGPSGCGKTSALRMVAGLEEISEGDIRIGGEVVNEVEARKRDVAMVFQTYALYPHMSVFENIAFPLRAQGVRRSKIKERVRRTAALLGLEEHLNRRPRQLSGGQRQRVAMGRAIVRQPRLYLMDEPLSNLDATLRVQMRAEIAGLQRELGVTTIYVTHDQVEAMTLGHRIAVLRKGVLQQVGQPQEVYDLPKNLFVATFIGSPAMNLFQATITRSGDALSCSINDQGLAIALARPAEVLSPYVGRKVAIGIRPEHLLDAEVANASHPRLAAVVTLVESLGSERVVHFKLHARSVLTADVAEAAADGDEAVLETLTRDAAVGDTPLVARVASDASFEVDSMAQIAVDTSRMHFFDVETGDAIR